MLEKFNQKIESGKNRLYNVLKAYALYDPDVGYTQGMNFIAALILLHVENEVVAWRIFVQVLAKDNWRRLYLYQTPKLFELTDQIRKYLNKELPDVFQILKKYNVALESLMASAFMTLFTNLVSNEHSSRILDRFMLGKSNQVNLFQVGKRQ